MLSKILKSLQINNQKLFYKNAELAKCVKLLSDELENEINITDLIDKIRKSSDLDSTLSIVVNEITDFKKSDKCIICLIDQTNAKNVKYKEFRVPENIKFEPENLELNCLFEQHYKNIVKADNAVLLENIDLNLLNDLQKQYFISNNIKSLMITPIIHVKELLGLILIHRNDLECDWQDSHSELLKKFSNQAASSIKHVILYAKLVKETEIKSEIIKNMSVEYKNHITSLKGFSELLLKQPQNKLSEKQKQYLANIVENAYILNNIINDMTKKPEQEQCLNRLKLLRIKSSVKILN